MKERALDLLLQKPSFDLYLQSVPVRILGRPLPDTRTVRGSVHIIRILSHIATTPVDPGGIGRE